ncbi:MAG: TMEM175 family protein [Marmoricola sp.]
MAEPTVLRNAERMKFFTDAVVAIAMTLLILPLLDSVSAAAEEGLGTADYLSENGSQLFAFVLSFVIIARFWYSHEKLFSPVERWTGTLMLLNVGWMLTIVFLPVTTAMVGLMKTDRLQIAVYVGTMLVSSLILGAMTVVVRRHPETWSGEVGPSKGEVAGAVAVVVLFALALLVALVVPGAGYLPLLLLLLSNPLEAVLERRMPG